MGKIDMNKKWFVTSLVFSYLLEDSMKQNVFPMEEIYILVYADDLSVIKEANIIGKSYEDNNLLINNNKGFSKYEGVCKVVEVLDECFNLDISCNGMELSYTYVEFNKYKDILDYINDKKGVSGVLYPNMGNNL